VRADVDEFIDPARWCGGPPDTLPVAVPTEEAEVFESDLNAVTDLVCGGGVPPIFFGLSTPSGRGPPKPTDKDPLKDPAGVSCPPGDMATAVAVPGMVPTISLPLPPATPNEPLRPGSWPPDCVIGIVARLLANGEEDLAGGGGVT